MLAVATGCTFDPSGPTGESLSADATAAASADASANTDASANASADATGDGTDPTWTVIETLVVDTASPQPTYSQQVLQSGVVYRLRVSGTITNVIDAFEGDADWYDFADPKDNGCCEDIGLGIDDFVVNDLDTQPDWGPYDPTHIYEVPWTGDGTTIAALFQDTYYGNNIGNLTLEILALQ